MAREHRPFVLGERRTLYWKTEYPSTWSRLACDTTILKNGNGLSKLENSRYTKLGILSFIKKYQNGNVVSCHLLYCFLLIKNSPIDPIQAYIGADMMKVGPEQREKIAEYWGLDQPIMAQFWNWSSALLTGDMGVSMIFRRPVVEVISERFFPSLALMLTAWVL